MPPEEKNLEGRNGEIWLRFYRGEKQADIAKDFGISQARVSQICTQVRESIELEDRAEVLKREIELVTDMRREILTHYFGDKGAPVTAGKDGDIVRDPDSGDVVRDISGKINAGRLALALTERLAKSIGLDAAQTINLNAGEEEASREAAAQSAAYLHGGTDTPDPGE